jgi:hypothetical protein
VIWLLSPLENLNNAESHFKTRPPAFLGRSILPSSASFGEEWRVSPETGGEISLQRFLAVGGITLQKVAA